MSPKPNAGKNPVKDSKSVSRRKSSRWLQNFGVQRKIRVCIICRAEEKKSGKKPKSDGRVCQVCRVEKKVEKQSQVQTRLAIRHLSQLVKATTSERSLKASDRRNLGVENVENQRVQCSQIYKQGRRIFCAHKPAPAADAHVYKRRRSCTNAVLPHPTRVVHKRQE
jgi:ribosomal protein L27